MKGLRVLIFCILWSLLVSCKTTGDVKVSDTVPQWATSAPKKDGMLCAVGTSEPTFYMEDAKLYAAENARKELARSLNLKIKNIMIDITTERGSQVDEGTLMEVSSWTTEVVLRESQIMEYWYDKDGVVSGRKGFTYALACIPLAFTRKDVSHSPIPDGVLERLKR